jgi:hypothetical protein
MAIQPEDTATASLPIEMIEDATILHTEQAPDHQSYELVPPKVVELTALGLNKDYAVAAYNGFKEVVAAVQAQFGNVHFDASTEDGAAFAKLARDSARKVRLAAKKQRDTYGDPLFRIHKEFLAQEKAVVDPMTEIEDKAKSAFDAEEKRLERIAAEAKAKEDERLRLEAARIQGHRNIVNQMKDLPRQAINANSASITSLLKTLGQMSQSRDFEELTAEAGEAYDQSAAELTTALDAARAKEALEAKVKADAEEIAQLRAEKAARENADAATAALAKADAQEKAEVAHDASAAAPAVAPPPPAVARQQVAPVRTFGGAPASAAGQSLILIPERYWLVLKAVMNALECTNLEAIAYLRSMDLDLLEQRLTTTKV